MKRLLIPIVLSLPLLLGAAPIAPEATTNSGFEEPRWEVFRSECELREVLGHDVLVPIPARERYENLKQRYAIERDVTLLPRLAKAAEDLLLLEEAEEWLSDYVESAPGFYKGRDELIDYYRRRLMPYLEIKETLRAARVAVKREDDEIARDYFMRAIRILDRHQLEGMSAESISREALVSLPRDFDLLTRFVDELELKGDLVEAFNTWDGARLNFPERKREFIARGHRLLLELDRKEAALERLDSLIDPLSESELLPLKFGLFEEAGVLAARRGDLSREFATETADEAALAEYFHLLRYLGEDAEARSLLDADPTAVDLLQTDTLLAARLYGDLGDQGTALRAAYTAWLTAVGQEAKQTAMRELYNRASIAVYHRHNLTPDGPETPLRSEHLDSNPSLLMLLTSLVLNESGHDSAHSALTQASARRRNAQLFMRLLDLPEVRADASVAGPLMREAMSELSAWGLNEDAVNVCNSYLELASGDRLERLKVLELKAESLRRLKRTSEERDVLGVILHDTATAGPEATWRGALKKIVKSYVADGRMPDCASFFWSQISRWPDDERLYEEFLSFLSGRNLAREEMQLYRQAMRHVNTRTWRDRFARYLIRKESWKELEKLGIEMTERLEPGEMRRFIRDHFRNNHRSYRDRNMMYEAVAEHALAVNPDDIELARDLIRYYPGHDLSRRRELAWRYHLLDDEIAKMNLGDLQQGGEIDALIRRFSSLDLEQRYNLGASLILPDLLHWRSRFEEALAAYRPLMNRYPGDRRLLRRTAALSRSLIGTDESLMDEAVAIHERLAQLDPTDPAPLIAAGEILAEQGMLDKARAKFAGVPEIARGEAQGYLDAATLYWDYYMFEDAEAQIRLARQRLGEPRLYTQELGAILESADRRLDAVGEYVEGMVGESFDWDVVTRLAWLGKRKGLDSQIRDAFDAKYKDAGDSALRAKGVYLTEFGDRDALAEHSRSALKKARTTQYLRELAAYFESERDTDNRLRALQVIVDKEGPDCWEAPRLIEIYIARGDKTKAEKLLERRVDDARAAPGKRNARLRAVLEEAQASLKALDMPEESLELGIELHSVSEPYRRDWLLSRLVEAAEEFELYEDVSSLVEKELAKRPGDPFLVENKARLLSLQGSEEAVALLYETQLERVKSAGMPVLERRSAEKMLMLGLARVKAKAGDGHGAQDWFIEALNREPLDPSVLSEAWEQALNADLTERFTGYYAKLRDDSPKDYRWHLLGARIAEKRSDLDGVIDALGAASAVVPQRTDIALDRAWRLFQAGRLGEAEQVFADLNFMGATDAYNREIALARLAQGDSVGAEEAARAFLAERDTPGEMLADARTLATLGMHAPAWERGRAALMILNEKGAPSGVDRYALEVIAESALKCGKAEELTSTLLEIKTNVEKMTRSQAGSGFDPAAYRPLDYAIKDLFSSRLGPLYYDYLDLETRFAVEAQLIDAIQAAREVNANFRSQMVQPLAAMSAAAGFYYAEMHAASVQGRPVEDVCRKYDDWEKTAERLEAIPNPHAGTAELLADAYRMTGARQQELGVLLRYFKGGYPGSYSERWVQLNYYRRMYNLALELDDQPAISEMLAQSNDWENRVNVFLEHGRIDLARRQLLVAPQAKDPLWLNSKEALLQLAEGRPNLVSTGDLLSSMGVGTIEQALARIDAFAGVELSDEAAVTRVAGEHAFAAGHEWADDLLKSQAEFSPKSPVSHVALGDFCLLNGETARAAEEYALAEKLGASAVEILPGAARLMVATGRADELTAWLDKRIGDKATVWEMQAKLKALMRFGFRDDAESRLAAYLDKNYSGWSHHEFKPLIELSLKEFPQTAADLLPGLASRAALQGSAWPWLGSEIELTGGLRRQVLEEMWSVRDSLQSSYDRARVASELIETFLSAELGVEALSMLDECREMPGMDSIKLSKQTIRARLLTGETDAAYALFGRLSSGEPNRNDYHWFADQLRASGLELEADTLLADHYAGIFESGDFVSAEDLDSAIEYTAAANQQERLTRLASEARFRWATDTWMLGALYPALEQAGRAEDAQKTVESLILLQPANLDALIDAVRLAPDDQRGWVRLSRATGAASLKFEERRAIGELIEANPGRASILSPELVADLVRLNAAGDSASLKGERSDPSAVRMVQRALIAGEVPELTVDQAHALTLLGDNRSQAAALEYLAHARAGRLDRLDALSQRFDSRPRGSSTTGYRAGVSWQVRNGIWYKVLSGFENDHAARVMARKLSAADEEKDRLASALGWLEALEALGLAEADDLSRLNRLRREQARAENRPPGQTIGSGLGDLPVREEVLSW